LRETRGLRAVPVLVVLAAVAAGAAQSPPAPAPGASGPADRVVVVSIDGMRWDYPGRAGAGAFLRLAAEGASCEALVPPFPSSTFPSHASLATGVFADRHGIVNNEFLDRERGPFRRESDASWLLAEPIWVTAERQGVRTAVYEWVLSSTPWHGIEPALRVPYSPGTTDADAIEQVMRWLRMPASARPRLILAYLHGADAAGHEEGPDSAAVMESVRRTDRLVGRLVGTLREAPGSALVVVSDHGMAAVSRPLSIRELLGTGDARRARAVSSATVCNVYCPDARACLAAESALRAVTGMTVYRRESLPEGLRYRQAARTGDLVAIAPRGAYFAEGPAGRTPARGMHGDPPEESEMQGIFYAWGAGVGRGARCDRLRAVDVAPFVCALLGISCPAGIDGRAPLDLLAPGALTPRRGSGLRPPRDAPP